MLEVFVRKEINMDAIALEAQSKMEKSIESLKNSLSTLRTGRANAQMLAGIEVDYYGSMTPINQLSSITIPEPRQLLIKPYDRNDLKSIVAAINASDLGLNPVNDGTAIRLIIPPLTEDRRRELAKLAKKYAEDSKVAIRNIRRDAMDEVKKDSSFTEDSRKIEEQEIQKLTDTYVKKIDEVYAQKEKDIMTI